MKIQFLGATKTVTGSCHLLEIDNKKILLDCGLYQGGNVQTAMNIEPFTFEPESIDFVLLSHAHIDHSGRLPKLYKDGFKGKIIATKATAELCAIMLPDSAYIQETEAKWLNKKRARASKHPIEPLYTIADAEGCLKLFEGVAYDDIIELTPNIDVRFKDAGHILGSAIIEIWVREQGNEEKIVFTGDLGNRDLPILRDPSFIDSADYLIMESTYGGRKHEDRKDDVSHFIKIIRDTIKRKGNVIIPSFAVGRTQEVIYQLYKHREKYKSEINWLKKVPVFVDSPLAVSATEVFRNNLDCYGKEARDYIENGQNPLNFPNLSFTQSVEESKLLNEITKPCVIISASGMCEAGRIKHHLRHNIWKKEASVIFVGYQAEGTLGRKIVNGDPKVRILGEEVNVEAQVEYIQGFSGHADQDGLVNWIDKMTKKPKNIFIVHGEVEQQEALKKVIYNKFGIDAFIPERGESYELKAGKLIDIKYDDKEEAYKFTRLEIIEDLILLNEEIEELTEILRQDLKKSKSDKEIADLKQKLSNIEKAIVNTLE